MEYIVVIIANIILLLVLKFAWNIKISDIKIMKQIGYSENLNKIANKLPDNKQICKSILKKLNNENVTINESSEGDSSFYFVLTNSIIISNAKKTFSRVQTICHECLHSVQNRKTLLFNFFFSNIYLLYFLVICILTILKLNIYPMLFLIILILLGFIYYAVRSNLENSAMLQAKPLAEEYLKEESLSLEEQKTIIDNCEQINKIGIPIYNFKLTFNCVLKIVIYSIVCLIFQI